MTFTTTYITPTAFNNLLLYSDGEVLTGLHFVKSGTVAKSDYTLPIFKDVERWLDIYFSGCEPDFTPNFRIDNTTPFRKDVLEIVRQIPFGKTLTYGDIASQIAKNYSIEKMSAQAVGGAVGWNPICIIVPCHRVLGANGNITGYSGGLQNKIELLKLEQIEFSIPINKKRS